MALRERIEQEIREAVRKAQTRGGGRVNVATRLNRVVVSNTGGGQAHAHAQQTAPIVQQPSSAGDAASCHDGPEEEAGR